MSRSINRRRLSGFVAVAAGLALVAAGCSSGGDKTPASGDTGNGGGSTSEGGKDTLNIWAGSQTPIQANFNPYLPDLLHATQGPIYESLMVFNKAAAGAPEPLLAESYEWNDDGTQMTIKLREGVKWTDGEDFTAEDVKYSITNPLVKASYVDDVEVVDDTTVIVHTNEPAFVNESAILMTFMVPEHIFGAMSDEEIMGWKNAEPVGTGPYKVATVSDAVYTLVANEDYWAGAPAVKNLRYLAIDDNNSADALLRSGDADWISMFNPDPSAITHMGYVNTPIDPTVVYTCSNADLGCQGAQTDVAVRQALSMAIDRGTIAEKAFMNLNKVISPTFALLGRDDAWIADGMPHEIEQAADVDGAKAILEEAGYTLGSDGIYEKDGKKVSMTLTSVDGWSDYNDTGKLIEEQARAAGIEVIASTVSWQEFSDARQAGNYELTLGGVVGTSVADPFMIYRDWFTTERTAKVGELLPVGGWGIARYSNPEVDAAVAAAAATNDGDERLAQYKIIQEHIVNDLPYIPIAINATQTFVNDTDFTGWPTEDDLFAFPTSWGSGSAGLILSKLQPASK